MRAYRRKRLRGNRFALEWLSREMEQPSHESARGGLCHADENAVFEHTASRRRIPTAAAASPAQERASGALAESAPLDWEAESPSAKVAEMDKFRCSGVPFRQ